jgi:hypothetical protein
MSRLLSAADYQREIAEAESMLQVEMQMSEQYGADAASELAIRSWQNRIASLKGELAALGDSQLPTQELILRYEGKPVRSHSIEVPFLATALRNFQTVITSTVGSVRGRMARSGRFSELLRSGTTLRVVETFPGSFGLHLETSEEQIELDGMSYVAEAVRSLVELMEVEDDETMLKALEPFDARAIVSYRRMLDHLKNNHADLSLQWYTTRGQREVKLSARRAERVSARLAQALHTKERLAWHKGTLDGAIKTKGFFQFITESDQVFSGSVAKAALEQLRDFYDRACEALITTIEITDAATGEVKTSHKLENLRPRSDT